MQGLSDKSFGEILPALGASGLPARALPGFMDRDQAIKFLMEDCVFRDPLTVSGAEEIWESRKAMVDEFARQEPHHLRKHPLSEADLKAARRFRSKHPEAASVIDFAGLNPMDLIVHKLWVSTAIADRYRDHVSPDRWLRTALVDPPADSGLKWRREGDAIVFDLPRSEYALMGPNAPDGSMRLAAPLDFVTVAFHAGRALLLSGYHRTFAAAQYALNAANPPRGLLFGVSNYLELMGGMADDVLGMMMGLRPPVMADFFDPRFFLPVALRKRRYQLRIQCEVIEIDEEEMPDADESAPTALATASLDATRNWRAAFEDGLSAYHAGRIDAAIAQYQRVLFLKPDHPETNNNLGVALSAQGRNADAVERYERALSLRPDYVDAHHNLGIALSAQGDLDGAISHHLRAVALKPDHAEAHSHLGYAFACQGRFGDAVVHYRRAIAIKPVYVEAHFGLTEVRTYHRGDADLAALEALAAADRLPPDKALFVHFALGKALEDIGDYAPAWEHLRRGNALKRSLVDYDETATLKRLERAAAVFDRGLMQRFAGSGDPSSLPIFVIGMPRSGSTLIEQILASHPQVYGAGELASVETIAGDIVNTNLSTLDVSAFQRLGESYIQSVLPLAPDKSRIVDKAPGNFLNVGLIHLMLPNARIIHTVRDPIDTCVSCYSKLFASGQSYAYDLGELARCYRAYAELMSHWRSILPPDAILEVAYEDVVNDLEGQTRRLIDYCGLAWDDRCISFHKTTRAVKTASTFQVRQPLFRGSLQRWRRYEAGIDPLLRELGDLVHADLVHQERKVFTAG